jgi:hypothetical protein
MVMVWQVEIGRPCSNDDGVKKPVRVDGLF